MLTSLASSLTLLLLAASTTTTLALPAETLQRKVAAAPASSSSTTTTTNNNPPLPPAAAVSEAYYRITAATIFSLSKTETFKVTVQGVEAGALPVPCTLTWTPPVDNATSVQNLTCVTEQVHVTLVRASPDPAKAWFLTVRWEGYGAAEWRNRIEYDPAWTKETTTTDAEGKTTWTFAGGADGKGTMINGAVQTKPEDLAKILAAPSGGLGPYLGWA
ncbi:hypothetical protein XPA_000401 [Xanthoria parietina]